LTESLHIGDNLNEPEPRRNSCDQLTEWINLSCNSHFSQTVRLDFFVNALAERDKPNRESVNFTKY